MPHTYLEFDYGYEYEVDGTDRFAWFDMDIRVCVDVDYERGGTVFDYKVLKIGAMTFKRDAGGWNHKWISEDDPVSKLIIADISDGRRSKHFASFVQYELDKWLEAEAETAAEYRYRLAREAV